MRRQQPELHLLRVPDALAAALAVWRPHAGQVGQLQRRGLLHPGVRLPQRAGPPHRDRQRPRHVPAPGSGVQRYGFNPRQ